MRLALIALAFLPLLAACGPIPLAQAEEDCLERARLAVQPRGSVFVGVGTDGPILSGEVSISDDFIAGRDPSQVFDSCVVAKSGQMPSRPLYLQPGWTG